MFAARKRDQAATGDPSALDALLDAEHAVALSLQEAEQRAEHVVRDARAAAQEADAAGERELREALALLDTQAARQRDDDARAIRDEAERRRQLYADADDARVAAIADRIAQRIAPAAP